MSKVYLPIGASKSGSRPPADIETEPFINVDGTVMLLNEMITAANVRDSNVRDRETKYTIKFRPYKMSMSWLRGNIIDICTDYVTVESEVGAYYKITDISQKRIRLL